MGRDCPELEAQGGVLTVSPVVVTGNLSPDVRLLREIPDELGWTSIITMLVDSACTSPPSFRKLMYYMGLSYGDLHHGTLLPAGKTL